MKINKKNVKRNGIISIFLVFTLIITQIVINKVNTNAATIVDSYLTTQKTATSADGSQTGTSIKTTVGEKVTLNYSINSKAVPSDKVNDPISKKKIVLVIDTSGSMNTKDMGNGQSRLNIVIASAKNFVDSVASSDAEIAIVPYSSVTSSNVKDFTSDKKELKDYLDRLRASGGTNIGDGLRSSYFLLQHYSDSQYKKYTVLLTDGQPTNWSALDIGGLVPYTKEGYFSLDVKGTGSDDRDGRSLAYANTIGDMIGLTKVNTFMVGFTGDIDASKLNTISRHAHATVSTTMDQDGLNSVYDAIADKIKSGFSVNDIQFEETFPADVEIVTPLPEGFSANGQTVSASLPSLEYKASDDKKSYILNQPLPFKIQVKFKTKGSYSLSNSSKITYKDIQNQSGSSNFNSVSVDVSDFVSKLNNIPITFSREVPNTPYDILSNGSTQDIVIKHTITPGLINFNQINNDDYNSNKYIVVVTDTSTSMSETINGKSKLDILKNTLVANNDGFINKFKGTKHVNIALVDYSYIGVLGNDLSSTKIKNAQGQCQDFADMNDTNQVNALISQVNSLKANGATNIGDGIRRAYYLLDKIHDDTVKKYVVLMTDGIPTAFTYQNDTFRGTYDGWNENGRYVDQIDHYNETFPFTSINSVNLNYDDVTATNYLWNSGSGDIGGYAQTYSDNAAAMLASKKIGTYVIGFSDNGINTSKLKEINTSANGKDATDATYKEARSPSDLQAVYTGIATEILKDIPIKDLYYETFIPTGLSIKEVKVNGNKLTNYSDDEVAGGHLLKCSGNSIGDISYKLSADQTQYLASTLNFQVTLTGNTAKMYTLDKTKTFISFTDLNNQTTKVNPDSDKVIVVTDNSNIGAHGLVSKESTSLKDYGITQDSVNVVDDNKYKAAVKVSSIKPNSLVRIDIGARDSQKITNYSDTEVELITFDGDTARSNTTKIILTSDNTTYDKGAVSFKVTLPAAGNYIITYTFKMNMPTGSRIIKNTATLDNDSNKSKVLQFNLTDNQPDLF